MSDDVVLRYVRASAELLALPLDDARCQAVAEHLARTWALASLLEDMPMAPDGETSEVFCPAPFPASDDPWVPS